MSHPPMNPRPPPMDQYGQPMYRYQPPIHHHPPPYQQPPPRHPPPNYPRPAQDPYFQQPPMAQPRGSIRDERERLCDNDGMIELKSNVLIITQHQSTTSHSNFFKENGVQYVYESTLPTYKIAIGSIIDRKTAEDFLLKFKKEVEGKENRDAHWGKEYWMRQASFNNEKGICRINIKHIPPTVIVNEDKTYRYLCVQESRGMSRPHNMK
ncbi:RRM domain-containing protein [Entamoeba marina]